MDIPITPSPVDPEPLSPMDPVPPSPTGPVVPSPVDPDTVSTVATVSERAQARRETLRLLARRPAFIIGNLIVLGWIITAVLGERITPYDPFNQFFAGHLPPTTEHWMGTDRLGRDVLSRVMVGSRDVLIIAPLAALLGVTAGTALGLVMGFYRGTIDDVLSRIVEAFLALPVVLIALLTLVVLGSSPLVVVFVVGILFTPIVARTVRSAVLTERQLDYVTAARLRGESGPFILSREIFPNVLGPTVVEMTVRFGYAIFTVATLSFLGVGLQPPSPDWGLTVAQEYNNMIAGTWWPTLFPALAIASTVVAVNLVADSIQSVMSE
jgi:peptide/nickel transport system permease protein